MLRNLITVVALTMALLTVPMAASAATFSGYPPRNATETQYPAPPVTHSLEVLGTSRSVQSSTSTGSAAVAQQQTSVSSAPDANDLAYTGTPFNVWIVAFVAAALLGCGVALIVAGSRLTRRRHRRHV